jgi:hypothetical protein
MSDQNNRSSGFNLGLIFGLLVGFLIAVLIYKNNPKVFANLADKLNSLIKDISSGYTKASPPSKISPPPSKTIAVAKSTPDPAPRRSRRPKTFVRSHS